MPQHPSEFPRRTFLRLFLTVPTAWVLAACGRKNTDTSTQSNRPVTPASSTPGSAATAQATLVESVQTTVLAPTPACGDDDDDLTPAQTEGPYYTPNTPLRASFLEPGVSGTRMIVTGYVLSTACVPVAEALVDFWHADDAGVYDNVGFKLRGHQFTDAAGKYTLETIVPGIYPGRTRHFHVKVQAANQPVLTTQLYFPGESTNPSDGIFNTDLLMDVQDMADGKQGTFNFVLAI